MSSSDPIEVELNYLAPTSPRPVVYLTRPPRGEPRDNTETARRTVAMRDARRAAAPSLDESGFALVRHETAVEDLWDPDQVRARYWPEVERLVAAATGADKVLAFDFNTRSFERARRGDEGAQRPVKFAHNDYTLKSGPQRVRDLLATDECERRLQRRFAVINVWKPIRGPVVEAPLAVCDARSIPSGDFVQTDLVYADRVGEVYSLAYSEAHRWYYFPEMQADEAMLLKCYDSADDGRARFTAHTAFNHPRTPADAPCRESIEVRTLAFF